jgi:hypothetical protein
MHSKQVSLTVTDTQISGKKDTSADTIIDMTKTTQGGDETIGGTEQDGKWDFETQTALKGWYPTLRKAIWLLSRIYRLVNVSFLSETVIWLPPLTSHFSLLSLTILPIKSSIKLLFPFITPARSSPENPLLQMANSS